MDKKTRRKIILSFLLFIGLTAGITILLFPYFQKLSDPDCQKEIQLWVSRMGPAGLAVILGMQILQVVIAFIPGEPLELLAGVLYGAAGGMAVCLLGSTAASILIFSLSRRFGKKMLYTLFGREKVHSWKWLQDSRKCTIASFLLFFIPGTPKDMLTYIIGVTDMPAAKFIAISTFARIPSVLSSTMIGSSMCQGRWELSLIVFLLTGTAGIAGLALKEKAVQFCQKKSV